MALKYRQSKNGVRFRYHKTRKHGAVKDRYWSIRHTVDGKQIEEALGYSSEGMTETKAIAIGVEFKANKRAGIRPQSMAEKRAMLAEEEAKEAEAALRDKSANRIFTDYFNLFLRDQENDGWKHTEVQKAQARFTKWIEPVIGSLPARSVKVLNLKRIVRVMEKAGMAPRTIVGVIGLVGHTYNHIIDDHAFPYANPVNRKKVLPKRIKGHKNSRERFLTTKEATDLLSALPEQVSHMAQISLLCGFRAGEIFKLKWADVNFTTKRISIRDTKSGKPRVVVMPDTIVTMLEPFRGTNDELVFPNRYGKCHKEIPRAFKRTVEQLGLNDGIEDRRQRVVFHTLRHTCASWLVEAGVDLYTVQKILGHGSILVTQRYTHGTGQVVEAAAVLDNKIANGC